MFSGGYEKDDPAYPGFALISVSDEDHPFYVRRSNYDEDIFFERKFTPNPTERFIPVDQLPLMGWQITPEFFHTIQVPEDRDNVVVSIPNEVSINSTIKRGDVFLIIEDTENNLEVELQSPFDGKIADIFDQETFEATGQIILFRANKPLSDYEREMFDEHCWDMLYKHEKYLLRREAELQIKDKIRNERANIKAESRNQQKQLTLFRAEMEKRYKPKIREEELITTIFITRRASFVSIAVLAFCLIAISLTAYGPAWVVIFRGVVLTGAIYFAIHMFVPLTVEARIDKKIAAEKRQVLEKYPDLMNNEEISKQLKTSYNFT